MKKKTFELLRVMCCNYSNKLINLVQRNEESLVILKTKNQKLFPSGILIFPVLSFLVPNPLNNQKDFFCIATKFLNVDLKMEFVNIPSIQSF